MIDEQWITNLRVIHCFFVFLDHLRFLGKTIEPFFLFFLLTLWSIEQIHLLFFMFAMFLFLRIINFEPKLRKLSKLFQA